MTKRKIGINGLGRIGRTIIREFIKRNVDEFEVVAVNNPGTPSDFVHLLKYDSVHGKLGVPVKAGSDSLTLGDMKLKFTSCLDPAEIPWEASGVDLVIDATGIFRDNKSLSKHIRGSVKKVILCAPGKEIDATLVMGINHTDYDPAKHNIVSNASCTTNCLAPLAKVLNDSWGIERGLMTTIHAYTGDQPVLDFMHSDPRRSRAAALSMIPTTTGAAGAVGLVIPELQGKLDGYAVRVPTPDVSLVDFTAVIKSEVSKEAVNAALKEASEGPLAGILAYTEEQLVSVDFIGMRESSCVDSSLTKVIGNTVKIVSWYDNEIGFSNRVLDLVKYMGERL